MEAMNDTGGKLNVRMLTDMTDPALITVLSVILAISCIMALLLIIPATIQYIGSLNSVVDSVDPSMCLNVYERNLYRYRLLFNLSVFLIMIGSSIPLLINLISVSHQNKGHLKVDETMYEFIVSLWGVCQVLTWIDVGGRIFFAWMIALPTITICIYLLMKKSKPELTFRLIIILSFVAFVFAYLSPIYLVLNLWKKRKLTTDNYFHCVSHKRNKFYMQIQMFELLLCHLLPVLIIVPSIVYTCIKMRFSTIDIFYEPIIFAVVNTPFIIIEITEYISIANDYKFGNGQSFANFYMIMMTMMQLSYTCMFLVAPIRSMRSDGVDSDGEKIEINNVYLVLIKKKSMRKNFEKQFSLMLK